MPQLTDQQIATVARQAGFTGTALIIAIAVSKGESGGNSDATNKNSNGSTDSGLWQINSVHNGLIAGRNVFDPAINAQLAFQISGRGGNWNPWTVYKSGAYKQHWAAAAAAAGMPDVPVPTGGGSGGGAGADISSSLDFFTNPAMWLRVSIGVLGGVLLLFALWKLAGIGLPGVGQAAKVVKKISRVSKTGSKVSKAVKAAGTVARSVPQSGGGSSS